MNSLVVIAKVPTVWSSLPTTIPKASEEQLNKREFLKHRIEFIANEIDELRTRLRMMDLNLSAANRDVVNELTTLNEQISELKAKQSAQRELEQEELDSNTSDIEENPESESDGSPKIDIQVDDTKTRNRKCKELFARIAKRCHPDKTKDTRLHALFDRAKKGRDDKDYELLLYIWSEIESTASSLLEKLLQELKVLEKELQSKEFELAVVKSGNMVQILPLYETSTTRDTAKQIFRMSIQSVILKRKQELMALNGVWPQGMNQ